MKYIYNWYVFWFAFVFWYMETKYFGWNATPQSEAELICDGIVLLIASRWITRTPNVQK